MLWKIAVDQNLSMLYTTDIVNVPESKMERLSTIQQVNSSIMFGEFTNDQLNSIISAVKFRRMQITKQTKSQLRVGGQVKFVSSRTGQTVVGTVEKVAIKYVTVKSALGRWKVPANMLEVA
jgi:hypothetical protein